MFTEKRSNLYEPSWFVAQSVISLIFFRILLFMRVYFLAHELSSSSLSSVVPAPTITMRVRVWVNRCSIYWIYMPVPWPLLYCTRLRPWRTYVGATATTSSLVPAVYPTCLRPLPHAGRSSPKDVPPLELTLHIVARRTPYNSVLWHTIQCGHSRELRSYEPEHAEDRSGRPSPRRRRKFGCEPTANASI